MIGGVDRHFAMPGQRLTEALDSAARAIHRRWRRAVFQSGEGEIFTTLAEVPLSAATELFVYRDVASLREWEAHGAIGETVTSMIHLLANTDGLTLVVGDPKEPVAAGVLKELEGLRFGGEFPRRAA